jgi:hypothetical protein
MKKNLFGILAATVAAGILVSAQSSQPAPQDPLRTMPPTTVGDKDATTTVTGCLIQGSKPTVFILENARTATDDRGASGKSYIVAAAAGSSAVNLKNELNHQVTITGTADQVAVRLSEDAMKNTAPGDTANPGMKSSLNEDLLPKLTARSVSKVGDTCPAAE